MERNSMVYQAYMRILQDELVPAMGCTEPIAVAYCAAKTREALAALPDRVELEVSGNIIKNVKSVVVPHTGGKRGMRAAVAAGIIAGDPTRELEVISSVSPSQIEELERYLQNTDIIVRPADTKRVLDIFVTAWKGQDWAKVHIADHHTNIVRIEKNGNILFDSNYGPKENQIATDLEQLTVERIFDFANTLNTDDVRKSLTARWPTTVPSHRKVCVETMVPV